VQVVEVNLAGPANVNGVLVAALAGLGRATFLLVKICSDPKFVAIQPLGRPDMMSVTVSKNAWERCYLPGKLVAIPDPEVLGLTQGALDALGVPDLLEQDAIGVVDCITREVEVVLVDDGVRGLDDVEGVEGYAARVEVLRALGKGLRNIELVIKVNTDICMSRTIRCDVLEEAGGGILRSHAEGCENSVEDKQCTSEWIVIAVPEGTQRPER
jgi:hypothetical protein